MRKIRANPRRKDAKATTINSRLNRQSCSHKTYPNINNSTLVRVEKRDNIQRQRKLDYKSSFRQNPLSIIITLIMISTFRNGVALLRLSGVKPLTPGAAAAAPFQATRESANLRRPWENSSSSAAAAAAWPLPPHPTPSRWGPTFRNRWSFYRRGVEMFDEMRMTFVEGVVTGQKLYGDENVGKRLVEAIGRINCEQETRVAATPDAVVFSL